MASDFLTLQYSKEEADIISLSPFMGEHLTVLNIRQKNEQKSGEKEAVVTINGSDASIEDTFGVIFNKKLNSVLEGFQNNSSEEKSMTLLSKEIEFLLRDEFNDANPHAEKFCSMGHFEEKLPILDAQCFEDLEFIGWDKFVELSADLSTLTLNLSLLQSDDDPQSVETFYQTVAYDNITSDLGSSHYVEISKTSVKIGNMPKSEMDNCDADCDDVRPRCSWRFSVCCSTIPRSYVPSEDIQSLSDLYEDFRSFLGQFTFMWKSFQEIDEKFWVVEPEVISPVHLHRRVMMINSTSVHIVFNQLEVRGIPSISFLGPPSEVLRLKNSLNGNIDKWNIDNSVLQNIYNILDVDESMFMEKPNSVSKRKLPFLETSKSDDPLLDVRCQICLTVCDLENVEGNENAVAATPDTVCSNSKCAKRYHSSCIKNWFLSLPKIRKSFDIVFGPCPICKSDICVKI